MSRRYQVPISDGEHRIRRQRTPPSVDTLIREPANPAAYYDKPGLYLPGQLGRFPTVGLDEGALKSTRPDTSPINHR